MPPRPRHRPKPKPVKPAKVVLPILPRPEPRFLTSLLNKVTRMPFPEKGSFNAALARAEDGFLCVYRPDEYIFKAALLSHDLQVRQYRTMRLVNCSDPRLAWVDDDLLMFFSVYIKHDPRPEAIFGVKMTPETLAAPEPFRVSPPSGMRQKNWLPFDYAGRLHLVESICPHIVHEFDLQTKAIVATHRSDWINPWFNKQPLRGNTNIVPLPDGTFLGTFHTAQAAGPKHTLYYDNGCYIFEGKPPFKVLRCSNRCYLKAEDACEPHFRKKDIIRVCFPCGMVRIGQDLWISYGDNDSCVKIMQTTLSELVSTTVEVYS